MTIFRKLKKTSVFEYFNRLLTYFIGTFTQYQSYLVQLLLLLFFFYLAVFL